METNKVITEFKSEREKEINIMTNAVAWFIGTYNMDPKPPVIDMNDADTEMYLAAVTRAYDMLEAYRQTSKENRQAMIAEDYKNFLKEQDNYAEATETQNNKSLE